MTSNPYWLIVEGDDDMFAIIQLMAAHINWPDGKENAPVKVESTRGVENLLKRKYLSTVLKTASLATLGVVFDADEKREDRYNRILEECLPSFPSLPAELPADGVIAANDDCKMLGVWGLDNAE